MLCRSRHCRLFSLLAVLTVLLLLSCPVKAHNPGNSYLFIQQADANGDLTLRWDIALSDLEFVVGLDSNLNQQISWQEVKEKQVAITAYAYAHLALQQDNQPCSLSTESLQIVAHSDGNYAVINSKVHCANAQNVQKTQEMQGKLTLSYSLLFAVNAQHRGIILDQRVNGAANPYLASIDQQQLVLKCDNKQQGFTAFIGFIEQGIWHILIGFDHILFIITLMLPAVLLYKNQQWQAVATLKPAVGRLLRVITAFTVAHSLTLTLATLNLVSLPSRWVEAAIALSVLLVALNTLKPLFRHTQWPIVFVFGLLHGFGFASVLGDLKLEQSALFLSLLGFNIGVEIGQLAILLLLFPIAYWLRHTSFYRYVILRGGSLVIALIATVWLVERVF